MKFNYGSSHNLRAEVTLGIISASFRQSDEKAVSQVVCPVHTLVETQGGADS